MSCCPTTGPLPAKPSAKPKRGDEYHAAPAARDLLFVGQLRFEDVRNFTCIRLKLRGLLYCPIRCFF
jgi:hypothetical protein